MPLKVYQPSNFGKDYEQCGDGIVKEGYSQSNLNRFAHFRLEDDVTKRNIRLKKCPIWIKQLLKLWFTFEFFGFGDIGLAYRSP